MRTDRMKFLITIVLVIVATASFAQEKAKSVDHYEYKARSGPFFTRWFYSILAVTPYAWKESLTLRNDGSFDYEFQGGECGTFDHSGGGTWTKIDNKLILQQNGGCYWLEKVYIIDKRKLYASADSLSNRVSRFRKVAQ